MKNVRKVFALVLALAMVMAMAVPAMAAGETYSITINNSVKNHIYEAYQIFSGELHEDAGKQVLTDIEWGSSIADSENLLKEFNETYITDTTKYLKDAAAVAEWISKNVTSDSETIDAIAALFGKYLGNPVASSSNMANNKYTITGLSAGYYLVKDKDNSLVDAEGNPMYDAYTKFILRVLKDQEVTPKSSIPEIKKSINDKIDGTFTKQEDFDIADIAYYKWEGTLPTNLKDYDEYYYKFTDTLPVGISFIDIERIYIESKDGEVVHTFYTKGASDNEVTLEGEEGVTLMHTPGDYTYDEKGKIVATTTAEQIELEFTDLLDLYPNLLPTHEIVVKYSALVNRNAIFAEAMVNEVDLEYSNNPNGDGHGKTTPDYAYAFTFQIVVDKYDADNQAKKLEGAEFILYYEMLENEQNVKYYAQVVTEEMLYLKDAAGNLTTELNPDREEINGKQIEPANLGNIHNWTTDRAQASILDTDKNGSLRVGGLDSGIYYLEETKAPAGYNLMESPVLINIKPSYTNNGASVDVTYSVDSIDQSSDVVGVRNSAGSTLPVTGGIGTTIFYILGSVMVFGAAVLLITKKRMAQN